LQAKLQLEVTENALQRAREQLRVNRALVDAGILPPVEIIQSEADIASQEFNMLTARTALESAQFSLIRILDVDRHTPVDPTDPIVLPEFRFDLDEARRLAYANRADYLQSENALTIAQHSTDVTKSNLLWDLSLSSRYRLDGDSEAFGSAVDNAFSRENEDWFVGLNLNIPVGDLSRRQAHLRASSQVLKAAIDLAEVRENIEIELQDAFRVIDLGFQRVRVAAVARELAERKLEIEKGKLQTGRTTNFAIVTFQNDVLRARLVEISAQISYLNSISSLDQTLGTTLATWGVRIDELDRDEPTRASLESQGGPPASTRQ
jgi:outer membrane protein TolC